MHFLRDGIPPLRPLAGRHDNSVGGRFPNVNNPAAPDTTPDTTPDTRWGRRRSKAAGGGQALDESCDVVDHTTGFGTFTAVRIVGRVAVTPPAIDEGCLGNRLLPEDGCVAGTDSF